MGGSFGTILPIFSTVVRMVNGLSQSSGSSSVSSALLRQRKLELEEERRKEAEERRKKQEQLKEARELAKDKLTRMGGRQSTIATGGDGLLTQADVARSHLKARLGE